MIDIGILAASAARDARTALERDAAAPRERNMGATARDALFCEALLGAVRAHVNALKTVVK